MSFSYPVRLARHNCPVPLMPVALPCVDCGSREGVEVLPCPFCDDIDDEIVLFVLCESCVYERADNI